MVEYDDKALIEMFADEDSRNRAFSLLVDRYSKRIYWVIRKIVVSHHDADDLVQNVFLKLWHSLCQFRGESGLYTWMYRIAVNEALSFMRSRKSNFFVSAEDNAMQLERIAADEGLFDGSLVEAAVNRAILRLPTKQRVVFTLRYYDEMPYEQMSEVLGTSVGALKASYHHAVHKVEEYLSKESL